jgi:hypothetical protein
VSSSVSEGATGEVTEQVSNESPAPRPPSAAGGWLRANALRVCAVVVTVQALFTTGYGGYLVIEGLVGHALSEGRAEVAGWMVFAVGLFLLLVGYGLLRQRRWARTPSVMMQLLAFWMSYYLAEANLYAVMVPLLVCSAVTLVLLLSPMATRVLYPETAADGQAEEQVEQPVERPAAKPRPAKTVGRQPGKPTTRQVAGPRNRRPSR